MCVCFIESSCGNPSIGYQKEVGRNRINNFGTKTNQCYTDPGPLFSTTNSGIAISVLGRTTYKQKGRRVRQSPPVY